MRLGQQLDRKLYLAVNKVLEGAGGSWSRKDKAHVFSRDPRELLGLAAQTGVATNLRTAFQAFYTPSEVARVVVQAAQVTNEHVVLEPSAGHGALIAAVKEVAPACLVHAVDADPEACEVLRQQRMAQVLQQSFLMVEPFEVDRVVMNPPFTGGQDMMHVEHALKFVKPGGVLVTILPAGTLTGLSRRHAAFLDLVDSHRKWVWKLPDGAFKSSGTMVRTVLMRLRVNG